MCKGLEADLVERVAGVPVCGERLGLLAAAIEREHLLAVPSLLTVRVRRDERVGLSGHGVVCARFELGGHPGLDRRQARLVESRLASGACERLVCDVRERRAAPEAERLREVGASATSSSKRTASSSPGSTRTR